MDSEYMDYSDSDSFSEVPRTPCEEYGHAYEEYTRRDGTVGLFCTTCGDDVSKE